MQVKDMVEANNEERYWQQVLARDANADGQFYFAVHSTGVYCRPSCPSRRPRREQVTFFRQAQAAEAAGFRPCRRCYPQYSTAPEPHADLIERVCRYIEEHLDDAPSLADLSAQVHLSPYHLQRTFKRVMGITPRQYAESLRLNHFKERLQDGEEVTSALYGAGYHSSSSVYERTPAQLGMTPSAYRQGGKGVRIGYSIAECPLGYVLIAATERGLAAVRFDDSEAALTEGLAQEYPAADLQRADEQLGLWITALQRYLSGHDSLPELPLDVHATAFQWKVWEALRAIPSGKTRSYREIARAIGQPTAARAVARACATNPVAVVIPCHRVVRENGQLGGYRWGIDRKQQLLTLEQSATER